MKILVVVGVALSVAYVAVFNPWNFFVPQSERFDLEKFVAIEQGDRLELVISELGQPTYVSKYSSTRKPFRRAVYFSGPPPDWLVGSLKAWLIVDENDLVMSRIILHEP